MLQIIPGSWRDAKWTASQCIGKGALVKVLERIRSSDYKICMHEGVNSMG